MGNSATQNPGNKVGRNSGAGRSGISRLTPTQREAERGLEPMEVGDGAGGWMARLGVALGVAGLLSAGAAVYLAQRARQQRSVRGRLERLVRMR